MDLKLLLLNGMASAKPLRCTRRIQIGKQTFALAFEVKGKMLKVIRIKQVPDKKQRLRNRLLHRLRRHHLRRRVNSIRSAASEYTGSQYSHYSQSQSADCFTQTEGRKLCCRSMQTMRFAFVISRDQQTVRKMVRKQGTQTEAITTNQRVQTETRGATRSCQTKAMGCHVAGTQTELETNAAQVQTTQSIESLEREKDVMVYLLNEIGEMLINQNHVLQNNSTMLNQISKMMLLRKLVDRQNAMKQLKMKGYKRRPCRCRYFKARKMHSISQFEQCISYNNRWTQTCYAQQLAHAATQTQHPRRWHKLFSCTRSSSPELEPV